MGRKSKWSYSEEAKEKLTNEVNKEPSLKQVRSSKRQKRYPTRRNDDFLWITE
jgi:hypothetical protein